MLDQKLQQKLLQKLSPQQIQMIKLLEVPAMQMEERIKKELEENPALEEGMKRMRYMAMRMKRRLITNRKNVNRMSFLSMIT